MSCNSSLLWYKRHDTREASKQNCPIVLTKSPQPPTHTSASDKINELNNSFELFNVVEIRCSSGYEQEHLLEHLVTCQVRIPILAHQPP